MTLQILDSARRHDLDDPDIVHAWENAIWIIHADRLRPKFYEYLR